MSPRSGAEVQALADDVGEYLARLRRLQAQIEVLGRLGALVTENAPYELVFAGPVLEDQSARRMAELMHGNTQSSPLLNQFDDLRAERDLFLVVAALAGKQPVRVAAAHQRGTEVMDVFVDDRRDRLVELELKRGPVLDIVLWERKPKIRVWSAGLDQGLAKANAGEVTQPDGCHRQDCHGGSDLGQDRGSDRRMTPLEARLLQKLLGQVDDPRPDPIGQHQTDQGEVLLGHSDFAVFFEREPEVSEPSDSIFIEAANRMGQADEPADQINCVGRGDLPILAPVAVNDLLGDVRMNHRA